MIWVNSLILFLAGVLGAAGLLKERFPNISGKLDSLHTYHQAIGVVTLVLGIIKLLTLVNIVQPMASWVLALVMGGVMVALGLIQGFGVVIDIFNNSPNFQRKIGEFRDKIWNYQEFLGLVAIALSVINIIAGLIKA